MASFVIDFLWTIKTYRLSAPFGTAEKPVAVTSIYEERIVGVPDPEDDCIITWGLIREGP